MVDERSTMAMMFLITTRIGENTSHSTSFSMQIREGAWAQVINVAGLV